MAIISGTSERTPGRGYLTRRGPGWFGTASGLAAGLLGLAGPVAGQPAPPPAMPPLSLPKPPAPITPGVVPAMAVIQPAPIPGTVQPAPMPLPGAQPGAGQGQPQPLPPPRLFPFADDQVRLPRLGGPLGTTPVPTPKDIEEFNQFIEGVIDPRNTLDLVEGRARLLLLKATPTQTQVADPSVLSLNVLNPRQITLIGRRVGTTVLNLWFTDPADKTREKVLSYLVRVIPDPEAEERLRKIYKALEKEVNAAFPNSRIELTMVGDKLMVSGQAHDIADAVQILRILRANAPGGQGGTPAGESGRVPLISVTPTGVYGDPTNPTGTPGLESFTTAGGPNVINNMRIPGEQQVMLRVIVAEVNRAAARSVGLNFSLTNNQGVTVFAQATGSLGTLTGNTVLGPATTAQAQGLVNLPINLDGGQVPLLINALRTLSYARSLAEPNLTAMNGQTATFLAGGQFPVPVIGGFGGANAFGGGGLQGVQYVPFGVQLAFTPIITDRDRIRLTMNATVSTRDLATGTNINGANVAGLSARTFSTTVELREGQTMAVAGLIQNNLGMNADRVPFFGDIPVLNRLASFDRLQSAEQELIVLITPELVHPLEQSERPPLPGSDLFEPGDLEFYLLGRLESRRSYDYRSQVRTDIHRMCAYRKCEQMYIFGPTGHADLVPVP